LITGIRRAGSSPFPSIIRFKHLPIVADKWWAWLLGFYFSSGCIYERRRYYKDIHWDEVTMMFAVHEDVIPMLKTVLQNIGNQYFFLLQKYSRSVELKDKGLGTTIRARIHFGSAVFQVLKKFGLPTTFKDHKMSGCGSRAFNPRIPNWVRDNETFMRFFFEGYLNGTRSASHLKPADNDQHYPIPNVMVYVHCNGRPEKAIRNFLKTIQKWLRKQGVTAYLHKDEQHKTKGNSRYILRIGDKKGRTWLINNLDIEKPDLRARLYLRAEADKDPVIYEILRKIHSPDNVILGLILEQPRTQDMLERALQIRQEALLESLVRLVNDGIIKHVEGCYYYEPDKFVSKRIAEMQEIQTYLKSKIWKYGESFLYQCQSCQKVFLRSHDRCSLCGSIVVPVARNKVLRYYVSRLAKPQKIISLLERRKT
jgi:hypothetical protein